jgi:putative sterol carrier protein
LEPRHPVRPERLGAEQIHLTIQDGKASVEEGETKPPKLTISGNSEYLAQMFTGETPPMKLVNAKLISMKGPMMDAIAFSGLWNLPKKG